MCFKWWISSLVYVRFTSELTGRDYDRGCYLKIFSVSVTDTVPCCLLWPFAMHGQGWRPEFSFRIVRETLLPDYSSRASRWRAEFFVFLIVYERFLANISCIR